MKKIFKYPLELIDDQTLFIPEGGEILSAHLQGRQICLWV